MVGSVEKGARVCLLWSLVPNLCDLSPGSHPFAEPGARQAVSVRERVCWGRVRGVSRRVLHAPQRVSPARAAQAGCGPRVGSVAARERWFVPPGSRGHLAAPELAGAPSVVIFASAYPHPLSFSLAVLPAVLAGRAAGTARPFPGDPSRSLIQPVGENREGCAEGCRLRGKHAVTTASVKLVAEARICGWLPYSATFRLPLSVAHAGSHHRSPYTFPWALMWEDSKWGRKIQWSVS